MNLKLLKSLDLLADLRDTCRMFKDKDFKGTEMNNKGKPIKTAVADDIKVEVYQGPFFKVYIDDKEIGHVEQIVGVNNRPTGGFCYYHIGTDKTVWNNGRNPTRAIERLIRRNDKFKSA